MKYTTQALLDFSEELVRDEDSFCQWASRHIKEEINDFISQSPEIEDGTAIEKSSKLEYDGYWMLMCKSSQELLDLLKHWHQTCSAQV